MSDWFDAATKRAAGREEVTSSRGLTRRRVVQGAAWSVPAIAIAAPVPAFAGASQGTITFTGQNCKLPGNAVNPYQNGAVYIFTACNTTAAPITINILSVTRSNDPTPNSSVTVIQLTGAGAGCTVKGTSFVVPSGACYEYALVTADFPNSANGSLIVDFTVNGQQSPDATTPTSNTLPPITPGGNCNIGGSCPIPDARSQCILTALAVPECPGPYQPI